MPRAMEIVTPLGEDVLLFHGMHGREELGRLSEYQVDLLSTHTDIDLDDILGQNVTVKLALPDEATRYFNGFVTRFAHHGTLGRYQRYHATLRPWLWFLTRTADCRIFQEKKVPEIVQAVFDDHGMTEVASDATGSYRTWVYCVQYRETDFNFVSRLLEHEGLYYYFRHTDGHHTLVLADAVSQHDPFPGYDELPFLPPGRTVRTDREHVSRWDFAREIQPGAYVHDDYDLERPAVALETRRTLIRNNPFASEEVYDYPGGYLQTADGEHYARVRIEELGGQHQLAEAVTNARGVAAGCTLTLTDHPRADQNGEYLVVAASYDLEYTGYEGIPRSSDVSRFGCRFTAMSTAEQFRPKRVTPKPFVQGPQTAVVVGPAGEEIFTDQYGRVKVQFRWDRYGQHDENSSCWMRVAQTWAGKGWGTVSTPRIGHEVLVDFLEGDPDQPIVVGSVHNAQNMPPHTGVVSGIRSNTHKGRGFNGMTLDDTAGKEKITIHGQYDMNTTVEHDQTTTVQNDQTNTVNNDFTETIKNNATITITNGNLSHDVSSGTAKYHVKGAVQETYEDTQSTTVTNAVTITSKSGPIAVSSNAQHIAMKAATYIQMECGASKIKMDSGGNISIDGVNITISGSANVTTKGTTVHSEASAQHQTKGAIVISEGSATNTVKGGMVMLNP